VGSRNHSHPFFGLSSFGRSGFMFFFHFSKKSLDFETLFQCHSSFEILFIYFFVLYLSFPPFSLFFFFFFFFFLFGTQILQSPVLCRRLSICKSTNTNKAVTWEKGITSARLQRLAAVTVLRVWPIKQKKCDSETCVISCL